MRKKLTENSRVEKKKKNYTKFVSKEKKQAFYNAGHM